jgi:hypothetical protein
VNLDATVRDFLGRDWEAIARVTNFSIPTQKEILSLGRFGLWIYTGEWAVWICQRHHRTMSGAIDSAGSLNWFMLAEMSSVDLRIVSDTLTVLPTRRLELDARLRFDALFFEGVLDDLHFGDEVGAIDNPLGCASTCQDHMG